MNDAAPSSAAELDEWLVLFRREASLTRSQFEVTLAGIQFVAPRLKGKLPLAKKVVKGLVIEYPAKHAFPMLSRSARFIASKMAAEREHRLGVCMLLQQATGLRPSEMLGLREHDIIRPSEFVPRYVLRLGTNVGTKVGREQTAFFDPEQDPVLAMLLFRLLRATPEQGQLAACSYDHYRRVLARHSACLGVRYSPHSCRAGFATEAISKERRPLLCRGADGGLQKRVSLCTLTWLPLCKWRLSFVAVPWIRRLTRPPGICWSSFPRAALPWRPMGLPVTVQIADVSEEEGSEYQPSSPVQAVRRRSARTMTPPPRVPPAHRDGRRRKLDGSSVLTPEVRVQLPGRGSASGAAGGVGAEPVRKPALRRRPVSSFNWLWRSCSKGLARLRMFALWEVWPMSLRPGRRANF